MLRDAKPVAFVATTDYDRARAFYEGVLGLEVIDLDAFALKMRVGDITLRIVKLNAVAPVAHTVFGFEVASVSEAAQAMTACGVAFERYDHFGPAQGADGVWTSPGGGRVAWFKDPDGNLLSISSPA